MNDILLYSGHYSFKTTQPFVVNNYFYYMTKCDVPNIVYCIYNKRRYFVNLNPNDKFHEYQELNNELKKILKKSHQISIKRLKSILRGATISSLGNVHKCTQLRGIKFHIGELEDILDSKRLVKSSYELSKIEKACKITSDGIVRTIKERKNASILKDLVGLFHREMIKNRSTEFAFLPILSQNKDNNILHYNSRRKIISHTGFMLMDVGCKFERYCSDITRVFPMNGVFTPDQTMIYMVVLNTLKATLQFIHPGKHFSEISDEAYRVLYNECRKIDLVRETPPNLRASVMSKFMPHRIGHSIGLDTHDVGNLDIIKEEMVLAIEPGLYFYDDNNSEYLNKKLFNRLKKNGGVRLEDTIVVTKTGIRNLSKVPIEIEDIQRLCK